jgi:hypothetical protein
MNIVQEIDVKSGDEMKEQRYCFMSDDDGHKYLIPLELRTKFLEDMEKAYRTDDFRCVAWVDEHRCIHPSRYSFTDPKEVK